MNAKAKSEMQSQAYLVLYYRQLKEPTMPSTQAHQRRSDIASSYYDIPL